MVNLVHAVGRSSLAESMAKERLTIGWLAVAVGLRRRVSPVMRSSQDFVAGSN